MSSVCTSCSTKAMAAWQWFNLHRSNGNEAEIVINIDETPINLGMQLPQGIHFPKTKAKHVQREPIARCMTRQESRTTFTWVAMLCNKSWLQPLLPQVLIVNQHTVARGDMDRLRNNLPSNVHLWREKTAWVTRETFVRVIALLGEVLRVWCPDRPAVLLMDTCPVHCVAEVLSASLRNRLRLVFIPAGCTSLLQPLDTHVLAAVKRAIRKSLVVILLRSPSPGKGKVFEWVLEALVDASKKCLCGRHWGKAFDGNGFGSTTFTVRSGLLQTLGLESLPALVEDLPNFGQFQAIFPAGMQMDFELLLGTLEGALRPSSGVTLETSMLQAAAAGATSSGTGAPPAPLRRRLSCKTCLGGSGATGA